jgi:hypothetical protein
MNIWTHGKYFAIAGLLLALAGCGGGEESPPPAPPAPPPAQPGTLIGAAGGTVTGPSGSTVVIPAGALTTEVRINIEQITAGAPALPSGFVAHGQMFAFTPHGTSFAVPVTMTLPFDPAGVPAGSTPVFYKTINAQTGWEEISGATFGVSSVSAQVTGFSDATVVIPPLQRNDPSRNWSFSVLPGNGGGYFDLQGTGSSGTQVGGQLERIVNFGPVPPELDEEMVTFTGTRPSDGQASGMVFGSASGETYGVFAEAPYTRYGSTAPIGGRTNLNQSQSYIKRAANASLNFTLSDIVVCGFDYSSSPPEPVSGGTVFNTIDGGVELVITAWTNSGPIFFSLYGQAGVFGSGEDWAGYAFDMGGTQEAWANFSNFEPPGSDPNFEVSVQELTDDFGNGIQFCLLLVGTLTYNVDLSTVDIDEEFTLLSTAAATAINRRGGGFVGDGQGSGVFSYLRDPISMNGTTVTFTGLEPTNRPEAAPPPEVPVEPAACVPGPGPDPAAGVIQLSASTYTVSESADALPTVQVTRSGGTRGAVTATFSTSDGTARSGTDYTSVNRTVFFADGDAQARTMIVPITPNEAVGPTKTVNLSLSDPGGCAALGEQTAAVLSIEDDERSPPGPSIFTIGGNVSGLAAGQVTLILQLPTTGDSRSAGNGPFAFTLMARSGDLYGVRVGQQPPNQVCTVANGTGTITGNVDDIEVTCVAAP